MLQFTNGTAAGNSGSLVYQYPNNTQSQVDIVLLTSYNGQQCTGPLNFFNSTDPPPPLPLVDCSDQNQVQDFVDSPSDCLFVYSSQGIGCQLLANSTIDAPNIFAFLDLNVSNALHQEEVSVVKISINKPNRNIYRHALIGFVVSLVVVMCILVAWTWWKSPRRRRHEASDNAHQSAGTRVEPKIQPDELDLFETFKWKPDSPYTECSICLQEYQVEELLRTLWCGHVFHKHCVNRWLETRRFCALCRSEFKYEV